MLFAIEVKFEVCVVGKGDLASVNAVCKDNILDGVLEEVLYNTEYSEGFDERVRICVTFDLGKTDSASFKLNVGFIVIIDETSETDDDDLSRVDSLLCNLSSVDPRCWCVTDGFVTFISGSSESRVYVVCRIN